MFPRFAILALCILGAGPGLPGSLVTDRRMETAVRSSYVYHVVLQDRVRANGEFGVLTLTGTVENEFDRLLAEDTARSVPWVVDVKNQVTLMPSFREGTDAWLALRVAASLRLRAGVRAGTIRVAASGGRVTLDGTVDDDLQMERTRLIVVAIPGVEELRNQLVVAPAAAGPGFPADLIDDPSIAALVIGALREQGVEVTSRVRVSVIEGAIRISGTADSELQKSRATQLAREAHGSRFVTNTMKLSP